MIRTRICFVLSLSISLFLPMLVLCQSDDSLVNQLQRKWINAETYALQLAELMPEAFYDFKPVPEERSFRAQLLHTAQNMEWLSSAYLFTEKKPAIKDTASLNKAAVLQTLKDAYETGLVAHNTINPKQLDEVVPFFAGPKTRRQILLLMHDHQTHHLGQLIVYLRLKEIKPPDYVGW